MTVRIINDDVIRGLKRLEDKSIHTMVTSPPYYALRDYKTGSWEGGDPNCDHMMMPLFSKKSTLKGKSPDKNYKAKNEGMPFKGTCKKCGAVREDHQIGLEETPEDYVNKLVEVFREVHRVLRDDGTAWLNLGDSYASASFGNNNDSHGTLKMSKEWREGVNIKATSRAIPQGYKTKDLMGIPWRVAFALQQDGWYLRQDIIWHKPNPMPESVRDRCTKAHEYIFLLTKKPKYFFDATAIQDKTENGIANKRDVWSVTVKPYKESHFATFPPELIKPCILAGTSQHGCCENCGSPWERIEERTAEDGSKIRVKSSQHAAKKSDGTPIVGNNNPYKRDMERTGISTSYIPPKETVGWEPTCKCKNAKVVPCTVLDIFGGSGTTAVVANECGRNAVLTELSAKYVEIAKDRIHKSDPLFVEITIEK